MLEGPIRAKLRIVGRSLVLQLSLLLPGAAVVLAQASSRSPDVAPPRIDDLQKRAQVLQSSTALPEDVRNRLVAQLNEAIAELEKAAERKKQADALLLDPRAIARELATASEDVNQVLTQLHPEPGPNVTAVELDGSVARLASDLEAEKTRLASSRV